MASVLLYNGKVSREKTFAIFTIFLTLLRFSLFANTHEMALEMMWSHEKNFFLENPNFMRIYKVFISQNFTTVYGITLIS